MNANFNIEFWVILGIALLLLVAGVVLYLALIRRSNPRLFYSSVIISWVLISLFPVVLLFSVFQDSSLTGQFTDSNFGTIAVGGAFGAFFVIWYMGTRNSLKAITDDHNEEKVRTLSEQIANLEQQFKDLEARPRDTRVIVESKKFEYECNANNGRKILGVITGDIQQVRDVDIWVNSENTNLQMARFYDPSISGLIRYLGAEKDREGNVIRDIIADALSDSVNKSNAEDGTIRNAFPSVKPGLAFATESGKLLETHKVQAIIHATTVFGEIGQGYTPLKNLGVCVQNALIKADEFASEKKKNAVSIVFPIFGTGTAKGNLDQAVQSLFYSVVSYFENTNSRVEKVYFLAWKEYEKDACLKVLDAMPKLTPKKPS